MEWETERGEDQASEFINKFVDRYQLHVQPQLQKHQSEIEQRCKTVLSVAQRGSAGGRGLEQALVELESSLTVWDHIAQPIQLVMKSRGLKDTHSIEVARRIRSTAVRLANEFQLHEYARRLTLSLSKVLQEVPEIAEVTEEDVNTLDEIITHREEQRQREEERRREVELDITIGRDRLRINNEFIEHKGRRVKTDEITRLRWGIFKSYTNGVRTNREFTAWATPEHGPGVVIECVRFLEPEETVLQRFSTVIDKLWKAAGLRIFLELAFRLMQGETIQIGASRITKDGMWLAKGGWFRSEPYFGRWEELTKSVHDGRLNVSSTTEKKASVSLPLRDLDNVVILDRLLDLLWKDGNHARLREGTLFQEG